MYKSYNANPQGLHTGDCVIRAISTALDQSWQETLAGITVFSLMLSDMPESNRVWGNYLKSKGYKRHAIDTDDYTVEQFASDHPSGTYILALSGHVVAVIDGDYIDTWDSGNELPVYYWRKE